MSSGLGAYLGEGVPWGTLCLQLESHPEPVSVTACSCCPLGPGLLRREGFLCQGPLASGGEELGVDC